MRFPRLRVNESGATSTELMLMLSVVVIAAVGGSYAYVPAFQEGVGALSSDVSVILAGGRVGDVGYNGIGDGTTGGSGGKNDTAAGATVTDPSAHVPAPPTFGFLGFHFSPFSFAGIDDYGSVYQSFFGFHFFQSNYNPQHQTHHYQNICGAYALSAALSSLLGSSESAQQIVQSAVASKLNIFDSTGRVTAQGLSQLAQSVGLCPSYHAGFNGAQQPTTTCAADLATMSAALAAGKVPVALIQIDEDGNTNYGRHGQGQGHYVLPQAITDQGVVVKDPVTGETRTLTVTEMCGAWDRQGREMVTLSAPVNGVCAR